jgi:hypothetical protein
MFSLGKSIFLGETFPFVQLTVTYKTPWPKFASELYRQSGRRLSEKLVLTLADRGVSRSQRNGSPRPLISVF